MGLGRVNIVYIFGGGNRVWSAFSSLLELNSATVTLDSGLNTRENENEQTTQKVLTMEQERRKYTRYEIGNAVTINSEGVYQIVDISEGGFRFKCPPHTAISDTWINDIINSVITLEGVPVRKMWESIYQNGNHNLPSLIIVGAKFGKLKKEEKLKLVHLIQHISSNQMLKNH